MRAALFLLLLVACRAPAEDSPSVTIIAGTIGLGIANVYEIKLHDGTQCAVVRSSYNGGVGITCFWGAR